MSFVDMMKAVEDYTHTENGAGAYSSTGNKVLDAFGSLGGMMHSSEKTILDTFYAAFNEDKKLAMRMLFYFRDIRGGQGMRRLFRVILHSLAYTHKEFVKNNMANILEYGRGDDYLALFNTPVKWDMVGFIQDQLYKDLDSMRNNEPCSLLAKWLPSENTSSKETVAFAKMLRRCLGMSSKHYRKMLSQIREYINVVETKMSSQRWDKIDYSSVPSKASMIYSSSFYNHDPEGYEKYLIDVAMGKKKINANALFPVDIIHKILDSGAFYAPQVKVKDRILYDCMWKALPNYFTKDETGICVVDTSGSMVGLPLEVAVSLGMYCADKAKGPFAGTFITFSDNPKIQQIRGKDIVDKVNNIIKADWNMSTNLEAVFNLILNTAIKNNCTQDEIPAKLYIISDMQFNQASSSRRGYTFMESMKEKYANHGYALPAIVYWNVRASMCGMFQNRVGDTNFCNVSGYSPSLFKAVIEGTEWVEEVTDTGKKVTKQVIDPLNVMLTALMNERYDRVWVG